MRMAHLRAHFAMEESARCLGVQCGHGCFSLEVAVACLVTLVLLLGNPDGGGRWPRQTPPCLSPARRAAIQARLSAALAAVPMQQARLGEPVQLSAPLALVSWHPYGSSYGVSNFFDHDSRFPDFVRDYQGGTRSYDTEAGYNHSGTDFFLWPHPWRQMEQGMAHVVAAAPGVLLMVEDGHEDHHCSWEAGDPQWNAVYLRHDDGSVSWYGHLAAGSLTTRQIGQRVERGEFLGLVGSSGISTGPHLHFEVYDPAGRLNDPYGGPGNELNPSWWQDQPAYHNPRLVHLAVHQQPPNTGCVDEEVVGELQGAARPGQLIYLAAYYFDQAAGLPTTFSVYAADGSPFRSWTFAMDEPYFAGSYWYFGITLPSAAPPGLMRAQAEFQGKVVETFFRVDSQDDWQGWLWLPHLTRADGGFSTTLILGNPGSPEQLFQLQPFGSDGTPLTSLERWVDGGTFVSLDARILSAGGEASHLAYRAGPGCYLQAVFSATAPRVGVGAHVLAPAQPGRRFALHPAEWDTAFDGLAVVNLSSVAATLSGSLREASGRLSFQVELAILPPLGKFLLVLADAFPERAGERVEIDCDQPCALLFLRGSKAHGPQGDGPQFLYQTQPILLQ